MEYFFLLDKHLPEGVGIDAFGPEHTAWLIASVFVCVLLCLYYRRLAAPRRRRFATGLAFAILFLELFRIAAQVIAGVFTAKYLPLHLCALATYLTLIHAFTGSKLLGNILYGLCMPAAIAALVFSDWLQYPVLNIQSIQSFLIHILLMSYPVMLMSGGDLRPRAKMLPKCLLFIIVIAVPLYFLNKVLDTNFFFLNQPSPGSPLELFAGLWGNPGYIFGIFIIIAVLWLLLYLPVELYYRKKPGGAGHQT
jgi:hypothetical integral membrane protein (TIGR02206 family)